MIQVLNRQRRIRIDSGAVNFFCGALAESLDLSEYAFSVIFVGPSAIRRLNGAWRKKDRATDVLSFSYGDEIVDGLPFLGEIVISPEVAARQAESKQRRPGGASRLVAAGCKPAGSVISGQEKNCRPIPAGEQDGFAFDSTEREIRKLIVHGVLHLMGYDHETDDGDMLRMQNRVLRRRFFMAAPYLFMGIKGR